MAKIYSSGNYVIVEDGDNLYEYAKGHTLYVLIDDIFYIKEITQGQYKVSVSDLEAGNITAEDSGDVYTVARFTTFLRENTGFKTAPGGSGAEWGSIRGTLSTQSDLQSALDSKQDDLVSGTNIKTINGNSVLGSGDLTISGGGGIQGLHTFLPFPSGNVTSSVTVSVNPLSNGAFTANRLTAYPYIPAQSFTASNIFINVTTAVAGSLCRIAIYSDLNGYPDSRLFVSSDLDCSTTGQKTALTTFNFVAGTKYWLAFHGGATTSILSLINPAQSIPLRMNSLASAANSVFYLLNFSTPTPSTFLAGQFFISQNLPYIGITKA